MDIGKHILLCGLLRFWYALFHPPSTSQPITSSSQAHHLTNPPHTGGFFFTLGATLTPAFNAYGAYTADPTGTGTGSWDGISSQGFHASYAFFLLFMGLMCLVFVICALRTNVALVTVHFGLMMTFLLLAGSYWETAQGEGFHDLAYALQQVRFPLHFPCPLFVSSSFHLSGWLAGWLAGGLTSFTCRIISLSYLV